MNIKVEHKKPSNFITLFNQDPKIDEEKVYFSDDYLSLIKTEFSTGKIEEVKEPKKRNYERESKMKKVVGKKQKTNERKDSNNNYENNKKGKKYENNKKNNGKNNYRDQKEEKPQNKEGKNEGDTRKESNEVKPKTDDIEVIQTVIPSYKNNNKQYEEYITGYNKTKGGNVYNNYNIPYNAYGNKGYTKPQSNGYTYGTTNGVANNGGFNKGGNTTNDYNKNGGYNKNGTNQSGKKYKNNY